MTLRKASIALGTAIAALAGASAFNGASAGFIDGRYRYFAFEGDFSLSRPAAEPEPARRIASSLQP